MRRSREGLSAAQTGTERRDARRWHRIVGALVIAGAAMLPLGIGLGVLGAPFGVVMPLLMIGCVALLGVAIAAAWASDL